MLQQTTVPQEKTRAFWSWRRWLDITFIFLLGGILMHQAILPAMDKTAPFLRDPIWYLFFFAPLAAALSQIGYFLTQRLKDRSEPLSKAAQGAVSGLALGYLFSGVTYLYLVPLYALVSGLATYCGHFLAREKPSKT
jgi:hypothetical protein